MKLKTRAMKHKMTMTFQIIQLNRLTGNPQNKRMAMVSLTIVPLKNNHRRMKSQMMRTLT
jgi:hypothetical protein